MAEFHRTLNGTPWLKITCQELSEYSENERPICDECLKSLVGCEERATKLRQAVKAALEQMATP